MKKWKTNKNITWMDGWIVVVWEEESKKNKMSVYTGQIIQVYTFSFFFFFFSFYSTVL